MATSSLLMNEETELSVIAMQQEEGVTLQPDPSITGEADVHSGKESKTEEMKTEKETKKEPNDVDLLTSKKTKKIEKPGSVQIEGETYQSCFLDENNQYIEDGYDLLKKKYHHNSKQKRRNPIVEKKKAAFAKLLKFVEAGDPNAMIDLAACHRSPLVVEHNLLKTYQLVENAATTSPFAQWVLAGYHTLTEFDFMFDGVTMEERYQRAFRLNKLSADEGNFAPAQFTLYCSILNNRGLKGSAIPDDDTEESYQQRKKLAIEYCHKAAAQGYTEAVDAIEEAKAINMSSEELSFPSEALSPEGPSASSSNSSESGTGSGSGTSDPNDSVMEVSDSSFSSSSGSSQSLGMDGQGLVPTETKALEPTPMSTEEDSSLQNPANIILMLAKENKEKKRAAEQPAEDGTNSRQETEMQIEETKQEENTDQKVSDEANLLLQFASTKPIIDLKKKADTIKFTIFGFIKKIKERFNDLLKVNGINQVLQDNIVRLSKNSNSNPLKQDINTDFDKNNQEQKGMDEQMVQGIADLEGIKKSLQPKSQVGNKQEKDGKTTSEEIEFFENQFSRVLQWCNLISKELTKRESYMQKLQVDLHMMSVPMTPFLAIKKGAKRKLGTMQGLDSSSSSREKRSPEKGVKELDKSSEMVLEKGTLADNGQGNSSSSNQDSGSSRPSKRLKPNPNGLGH